jgi:hypothetical protein
VPDRAEVGRAVTVTATAPNGTEAGMSVLSWSALSGTFSDPSASTTSFVCTAPGPVTITLKATQERCSETLDASVTCLAPADGGIDGAADSGIPSGADGGPRDGEGGGVEASD